MTRTKQWRRKNPKKAQPQAAAKESAERAAGANEGERKETIMAHGVLVKPAKEMAKALGMRPVGTGETNAAYMTAALGFVQDEVNKLGLNAPGESSVEAESVTVEAKSV